MTKPMDFYADAFQVTTGAYGCTLNLLRSASMLPRPGTSQETECLATVRMSLEHLKVMVFILYRQLHQHEVQTNSMIPVANPVLNGLQIGPEDWEKFWKG